MTRKQFKYAALKYRSAYDLGEQVNIGLLFIFPDEQRVAFIHPGSFQRLNQTFPDVDLNGLKRDLRAFSRQAQILCTNTSINLFSDFDQITTKYFLAPDASALFFGEWKSGFYTQSEAVIKHYEAHYFSYYKQSVETGKRDEEYLKNKALQALKGRHEQYGFLKHNVILQNSLVHAQFDFAWQNGKLNLVRPLGFDLKTNDGIQNKSLLWFGKLSNLKENLTLEQTEVHFLLSEPNSKALHNAFEAAKTVLLSLPIQKRIILEKDIEAYTDQIIETIKPLPQRFF